MRKGVHFHTKPPVNGREFTADDVVWNMKRWQSSPFLVQQWFKYMESITALDKYTVEVKFTPPARAYVVDELLDERSAQFIAKETVPAGESEIQDWSQLIGTGPFMIDDLVPDASVTFVKNPNYWGYDELNPDNQIPYVDVHRVLIIKDSATQQAALRTGKITWLQNVQWKDADSLKKTNPQLKFRSYPYTVPRAFKERNDIPPFDDVRVRQAINMAIDRKEMADTYYGGTPHIIGDVIFPGHVDVYTPPEEYPEHIKNIYTYNPEGAKQLLAEAGYPSGFKTTVDAWAGRDPGLCEIFQSYLAGVGIDVEIKYHETGAFRALRYGKKHEGVILHWNVYYANPSSNMGWFADPTHTFNTSVTDDPVLTEKYETLLSTFDLAERNKLMKELNMYMLEQSYYVPMPMPQVYTAWQPWLKGYRGEGQLGLWGVGPLFARVWIDQELKESMGH